MPDNFHFCRPKCESRTPGCQDHCDFYAERRKVWDELKAKANADRDTRQYLAFQISKNIDNSVKNKKRFAGHAWRRYGK